MGKIKAESKRKPLVTTPAPTPTRQIAVLLHDIRSIHNVGSIFRTANALGATKIYLSGFTPTPVDRFGNPRSDFAKVSLGAERALQWQYFEDPKLAIKEFKKGVAGASGVQDSLFKPIVIAIEQDPKSVPYKKVAVPNNQSVMFIVGNEVSGIPRDVLKIADVIAEIPQFGTKESLNVAVAFGVVGFGIAVNT